MGLRVRCCRALNGWAKPVAEWRKELGLVGERLFDFGIFREAAAKQP